MFVVPNLTLLIQDLAFFALLFLIARYLYRPIQQVLEARTKRIQDGLRAAEEAKRDREAAEISVRTLARPRSSSESGLPLPEEARRYDLSL